MRYLRLFSVVLLLSICLSGCHRQAVQPPPPVQAQAPIVTTLPPMPPLAFPDVQLAKPAPPIPPAVLEPVVPAQAHPRRVHHHRIPRKPETESAENSATSSPAASGDAAASTGNASAGAAAAATPNASAGANTSAAKPTPLGQLSADDPGPTGAADTDTRSLIEQTEKRLKQVPPDVQAAHKEDIAQVASFLAQAHQAWGMNDLVGAQTLANKAKILLDDLLK